MSVLFHVKGAKSSERTRAHPQFSPAGKRSPFFFSSSCTPISQRGCKVPRRFRLLLNLTAYLTFLAAYLALDQPGLARQVVLVAGGRSDYVIVRNGQAPTPEQFAAQELQKYIRLISGVELRIVERPGGPKVIWVGQAAGSAEQLKDRGEDSYLIRVAGGNVYLTGATPRSTLYSVYHFLEKYLGCGWIVPGDEYIPRSVEIGLPDRVE